MLPLLDLRDLVRVLVAARVPGPRVLGAGPQYPGAPSPVTGALARLEEPRVAAAGRLVVPGRSVDQAVGVDGRLSVAEVGAVPAPADAPGHPGLLDRLADQHAVLLELLGQYRVEERVAAGVERQHEHGEHLRLFQRDQLQPERRGEGEERYGGPTEEVGEHQKGHPLGYSRVVRVPCLGAPDRAVHLQVASHEYQKRDAVDQHEKDDVGEGRVPVGLERQADGELSVVRDADQRQAGHRQSETPAHGHYVAGVLQGETLVQVHRVRYRVVPLQRDHRQRVHAQLGAEHAQEAG